MVPVIRAFQRDSAFSVRICLTAQHREMLDQVLEFFDVQADYDLDLMRPNQNLYQLTADIITAMRHPLEDFEPDYTLVHGDTCTTMSASIAAFYSGSTVCHVEAGLRTYNKQAPFPEEMNRQVTSRIADVHFAPTARAKQNLIQEQVQEDQIVVTGNTVIDALFSCLDRLDDYSDAVIQDLTAKLDIGKKIILVTGHRRENHGEGFIRICEALREIANRDDVQVVYPVHLNPNVKGPVHQNLGDHPNVLLIEPLAYQHFVWMMNNAYLVITDSGGVQEEAPSLGLPVLVMRETTERPEAVEAGTVLLVGTDRDLIVRECTDLLDNEDRYRKMSALHNPYGDGKASQRIVEFVKLRNQ